METGSLYLACTESDGCHDLQQCLVPWPVLRGVGAKAGDYISLKYAENAALVCRAVPVLESYVEDGYQVIACGCVHSGNTETRHELKPGGHTLQLSDVKALKKVKLKEMKVTVILKTVENVLQYRKNKLTFETTLRYLLELYCVSPDTQIRCENNPLAKLLGITCILIEKCSMNVHEVATVTQDTSIQVQSVKSEEKHRLSVRDQVSLGGLERVLNYLVRLIQEPWSRREEFARARIQYPSGVLLVGPPGCGKTSLVREICRTSDTCLVATAAAELLSPFEGETEQNFIKVVKKAQMLSEEGPCLFFMDEIDSLCPKRTQESSLHQLRLSAQVLLMLDECQSYPNLVLMAATNRPYDLDSSLRRSGRFEIEILLNVPVESERQSILAVHSADLLPNGHSVLAQVAQMTPGFVGADLRALADMTKGKVNEGSSVEDIISIMKQCVSEITPSIHKTLEYITSRPNPVPIGGLQSVKEQLHHIFLHHTQYADTYSKLKLKKPRGVLLYGPRGCGKTQLVASLSSSFNCTFLSANASHLLSPYVGGSEKAIAALFHAARLLQPTVLFIDEIDGIFGSREKSDNSVSVSILNELLQAMDGADLQASSVQGSSHLGHSHTNVQDGVLVCAATNHPEKLDPALLRPGRLDQLIFVPPPDYEARLDILTLKTKNLSLGEHTSLEEVADVTDGYTGAELENIVMRAIISAVQEGHISDDSQVVLGAKHLLDAVEAASPALTLKEILHFKNFMKNVCVM